MFLMTQVCGCEAQEKRFPSSWLSTCHIHTGESHHFWYILNHLKLMYFS